MLNLGGFANPDVLYVPCADGARVVKDYARRSALVQRLVAPVLVRHETAMLARLEGVHGVPRLRERIDRLAFAMDYLEGHALRRSRFANALPSAFFDELERILAALATRGVAYLDLRSPTNILVRPDGSPSLVDLASAFALPLPRALRSWIDRRAVRKLRKRFQGDHPRCAAIPAPWEERDLKVGGTRLHVRERGAEGDPVPVLLLHEEGRSSVVFDPVLDRAAAHGRRAIAVDLPGCGRSRRRVRDRSPAAVARVLAALVDALRLDRVDVVGCGWGGLVGGALSAAEPGTVRSLLSVEEMSAPGGEEGALDPLSDPDRLWRRLAEHTSVRAELP